MDREVSLMCNLSQGVEACGIEKGIKQGIEDGRVMSVRDLMDSMGWSADEAMNALRIPEDDRQNYLAKLRQ